MKVLLIIFIIVQIITLLTTIQIEIPWLSMVVTSSVLCLIVLTYGNLTRALIIGFGVSTTFHFHRNKELVGGIFRFFTIWMTILSIYSLLITISPISGFTLAGDLHPGYVNPVEKYPGEYIQENSFGFYGVRDVYTLTSVAFVFTVIYSWMKNSRWYYLAGLILFLQLTNIYWLTGSGRAGFVLPLFLGIIALVKLTSMKKWIPIIIFSPLILWILIFTFRHIPTVERYSLYLDEFMSHRLSMYTDSIQILISNPRSLIGWGPAPWGEYTLIELGVESSINSYGKYLKRPHNFAFAFSIQYGLLSGLMLVHLCWNIARSSTSQIHRSTSATHLAILVFLSGSIFTGLAVGGKIGPYPINTPDMILWWMGYGVFISNASNDK
jgi:hypothetical protein